MAEIAPPTAIKPKKASVKRSTKAIEQTPPNSIKPLQLKIPEAIKNEYKAFAAIRGRSMNSLFVEMFEEYKDKHA